ncbi:MAG: BrnT family toxin [Rhodocyclaceae bacterium]|nr:BrnT family toxin [Rhodocyclaceae bacterium]
MDVHFRLNGTDFVWDADKAAANARKHEGVTFEQAATVFFDPLFRLVDASRNDEGRDAVIGFDSAQRLLFVVHVQIEDAAIRIVSARRATSQERQEHEHL